MRKWKLLAFVSCIVLATPGFAHEGKVLWEYRAESALNSASVAVLANRLGEQGWELASTYIEDKDNRVILIFKRPKE
jgi:hypothetical protein